MVNITKCQQQNCFIKIYVRQILHFEKHQRSYVPAPGFFIFVYMYIKTTHRKQIKALAFQIQDTAC